MALPPSLSPATGPRKRLQHVLEQRTLISHGQQICVVMWCITEHPFLPCVGNHITPLHKQGHQQSVSSKSQTQPKPGLVTRGLALEVHEATNDSAQVSNRICQGHTNCPSAGRRYVV